MHQEKIFQPIAIYTLHLYCMCRDSRVRCRKNLIYFSWGSLTIFNLASFGGLIVWWWQKSNADKITVYVFLLQLTDNFQSSIRLCSTLGWAIQGKLDKWTKHSTDSYNWNYTRSKARKIWQSWKMKAKFWSV